MISHSGFRNIYKLFGLEQSLRLKIFKKRQITVWIITNMCKSNWFRLAGSLA